MRYMVGEPLCQEAPSEPMFVMAADPGGDPTDDLLPCRQLARVHPHARDARLRFEAKGHKYYLDEVLVDTSAPWLRIFFRMD
jgi:hypothetical protein